MASVSVSDSVTAWAGLAAMGVLFAAVGAGVYYSQTAALRDAETTTGEVIETDVRSEEIEVSEDEPGDTEHFPVVRYRYTYRGETYVGDNVFPGVGNRAVSESRARTIAERYADERSVTVYVQPEEPGQSFLISERDLVFPALFGGVGLLAACAGGWQLWRRRSDLPAIAPG